MHEVTARLDFVAPLELGSGLGHIATSAAPGVEEWAGGTYRRALPLAGGPAVVELTPQADHIAATFRLTDPADEALAVERSRRALDLDHDPAALAAALGRDPHLGPEIERAPGRRLPVSLDPVEMAFRCILGQQISTRRATVLAGNLARRHGDPLPPDLAVGSLTHLFPRPEQLAGLEPLEAATPGAKGRALVALARAVVDGLDLTPGADREALRERLLGISGIGAWTVEILLLRALGDPDAFPATDLGVRRGAERLGVDLGTDSEAWRPWRSYATVHLWAATDHPTNHLPD